MHKREMKYGHKILIEEIKAKQSLNRHSHRQEATIHFEENRKKDEAEFVWCGIRFVGKFL